MRVHVRVHAVRRRVARGASAAWAVCSLDRATFLRLPELRRRDRVAAAERPEEARLQLAQPSCVHQPWSGQARAIAPRRRTNCRRGPTFDGSSMRLEKRCGHQRLVDLVIRQVVAQREEGEPGRVGQMRSAPAGTVFLVAEAARCPRDRPSSPRPNPRSTASERRQPSPRREPPPREFRTSTPTGRGDRRRRPLSAAERIRCSVAPVRRPARRRQRVRSRQLRDAVEEAGPLRKARVDAPHGHAEQDAPREAETRDARVRAAGVLAVADQEGHKVLRDAARRCCASVNARPRIRNEGACCTTTPPARAAPPNCGRPPTARAARFRGARRTQPRCAWRRNSARRWRRQRRSTRLDALRARHIQARP